MAWRQPVDGAAGIIAEQSLDRVVECTGADGVEPTLSLQQRPEPIIKKAKQGRIGEVGN